MLSSINRWSAPKTQNNGPSFASTHCMFHRIQDQHNSLFGSRATSDVCSPFESRIEFNTMLFPICPYSCMSRPAALNPSPHLRAHQCVDLSGNVLITAHAVASLASVARGTCIQYVELGADDGDDDDSDANTTHDNSAPASASSSSSATDSGSATDSASGSATATATGSAAVSRSQSHEWAAAARALSNQLFRNRTERGLHAATDAHHIIGVDNEDHNEQELRRLQQQFGYEVCGVD